MDLTKNVKISNHVPMKHNEIVKKRISFINEGGGITKNIPKQLLFGSRSDYKNNSLKNFSKFFPKKNPLFERVNIFYCFSIIWTILREALPGIDLEALASSHIF